MFPLSYMCPRVDLTYHHWTWKNWLRWGWNFNEKMLRTAKIIYNEQKNLLLPIYSMSDGYKRDTILSDDHKWHGQLIFQISTHQNNSFWNYIDSNIAVMLS